MESNTTNGIYGIETLLPPFQGLDFLATGTRGSASLHPLYIANISVKLSR